MFTKEDYREYFEAILAKERQMVFNLREIKARVEDANILEILEMIAEDEAKHYSYVRDIFDQVLLEDVAEQRKFVRENFLGTVKMKDQNTGEEIAGRCLNISEGGMCVEVERALKIGDSFEVWIELFDKKGIIHCLGKLRWHRKGIPKYDTIGLELFRCGWTAG